ncbi:hypothetical protein J2Z48_002668 [Croceifilum oryzae]|uniref:Restriction endonuclease n=1 Tax=Croceifilum oryzae TaxID=1553429 RepID=A0AAJ1TM79_9BACL|nr:HaeIII family restriction endonuclease [Croceifilum oryzae]MDQ0418476.1 hypothetical protein [Croceifilum oryzae]
MAKQNTNGRALEYAFLLSVHERVSSNQEVIIVESEAFLTAKSSFESLEENYQKETLIAARTGTNVLIKLEPKIIEGSVPLKISIQGDVAGQSGDVRDVLISRPNENWEIGVSCKNNHDAVKHPRLSGTNNFGKKWLEVACTEQYFQEIIPIFDELRMIKKEYKGKRWSELADKNEKYYLPVLQAFIKELNRLNEKHPGEIPGRLLSYLLGRQDFYKLIVQRSKKITEIQGFNLRGTLNQKSKSIQPQIKMTKIKLPTKFYGSHIQDDSENTAMVPCDEGWSISCRIHNASRIVENSLKLDVRLEGLPSSIYIHHESWR